MRRTRLIAALALATGSAALCGAVVFEGGPDEVIFGKQLIPIYFNHDYHVRGSDDAKGVTGEGLDCDFCHENVGESKVAADRDIPDHGSCDTCHEDWIGEEGKPAERRLCAKCHKDLDITSTSTFAMPLEIPAPNIKFPHANHVEAGVQCVECHAQVPTKTLATRDDFPTMDQCIRCHVDKGVSIECKTCHLTGATGKLITELPQGKLLPRRLHLFAVHDADFLRDHAVPAERERQYCEACHTDSFCLECHDGIGRDLRYHPGDWLMAHPIKAKQDDHRCQSCHRLQSFCLNCHIRSGVAPVTNAISLGSQRQSFRSAKGATRMPHPMAADGWNSPASRNFHGFHAQRNIRSCASCHQEQYCLTCHMSAFGTGAKATLGGNPHGPNAARLKGSLAAQQNARACLKCHHPADDSWR